jgi:hypothetical protein
MFHVFFLLPATRNTETWKLVAFYYKVLMFLSRFRYFLTPVFPVGRCLVPTSWSFTSSRVLNINKCIVGFNFIAIIEVLKAQMSQYVWY